MPKGRIAIVTGASRGIGRETALVLASKGASVVLTARGNDLIEQLASEISGLGVDALPVVADVANPDDVERLFATVMERFGRVDILVNNAGITRDALLMRMKDEEWDEVIDTNLKGAFLCTRAAARIMMKQRYGRIINVTSVVGEMGNAGQANYCASKAGMIGLTKSTARELASRSITVNAVSPGFITTDMTDKLSEKVRQDLAAQIPLGRFGTPADVAGAVAFLASEGAGYITGHVLSVNGGMHM